MEKGEQGMRKSLEKGTVIRVGGGVLYKILGDPIGEGGGSIIYPAQRRLPDGESYSESQILYALKECYPLSSKYAFIRKASGEIRPAQADEEAVRYLELVKRMQFSENVIAGEIYKKGFRLTPALEFFQEVEISRDQGKTFTAAANSISIMESLSEKGQSLKAYMREKKHLPAAQAFRVIEQTLYAVREAHASGYLHLDLQDGNIFLKGTLGDASGMVSLIDFGSARKRMDDGKCAAIEDRVLYATPGFCAPEILHGNDGTLRLGPETDIYSIGCLLLFLLTGHRFSAGELCANQTGRYIPRFSIRKTRCPRHLVDKMQAILARALQEQPEKRYPDTEAMLAEVTEFLALLAPYRSPLSAMEYDAFICYRHGPRDNLAARELRNALERYRGGRLWGKGPIGRIFLDEGELASCADFGERIREALEKSRWLIVICSQRTGESPWVNEEIQTFLQSHDPSHVLAAVTKGEPGEVFPEALRKHGIDESQLFAADARAKSLRKMRKKIRGDVKLKIAAPLLDTTYDALKQRAKIYAVKKASALAGASWLTLSAFLGYAAVKSREIADQAVEIARERQAALRGQALYLSEQARQSYEAHDPMAALNQALQAWDLLDGAVPLPDLTQTLVKILGIYTIPANAQETVTVAGSFSLEEKGAFENYFLDSQGKYLFTAADSQVCVWNARTYRQEKTLTAPWTLTAFEKECLLEEKGQCLLLTADMLVCYDYEREKSVWEYTFDQKAVGLSVSADQSRIAVVTENEICILDVADGTRRQTADFSEGGSFAGVDAPTFSPDGKWAAFVRAKEEAGKGQCRLETVLYSLKEDCCTVVSAFESPQPSSFTKCPLHFTEDGQLCMLYGLGLNTVYTGDVYKYYSEKKTLKVSLYDVQEKKIRWEETRDYMALDEKILFLDAACKGQPAVFLFYGKTFQALSRETGKLLDAYETDSPIIQAWREEDGIALALENGDLLHWADGEGRLTGYEYFPEKIVGCEKSGADYYIRQRREDTFGGEPAIIRYEKGVCDPGYEACKKESLPEKIQYASGEAQADSPDGRYNAAIRENAVVIQDREGHGEKTLELEQAPLSLFWLRDSRRLLIGFSDEAALYDIRTETLQTSGKLEHPTYTASAWLLLDESQALYQGDLYSYALDLGENSFGILYGMKDFLGYDAEKKDFYFQSEQYSMERLNEGIFTDGTQIGKIHRYSEKEMLALARGRLRGNGGEE